MSTPETFTELHRTILDAFGAIGAHAEEATILKLADWIDYHGESWDSALRSAWMRGSAPAELHALRNRCGFDLIPELQARLF